MDRKLSFLEPGASRFRGPAQDAVAFTLSQQLLDAETWKRFVGVFRTDIDVDDDGWRCEYFGKMMRGACLTYQYTRDPELYRILDDAVRDLLSTAREDGRISTYAPDHQLCGWDLWGRKYVLTGCLHFYRICNDDALREEILRTLCRHADAVLASVGPEDGKQEITRTSDFWGGVNSCSILEPMLDLYQTTGEEKYLRFGEYILATGGCRDGDLIALAREDVRKPYQYPEVKAYETMSFFEGVLAYYELTGKTEYLDPVLRFVEAVAETDITVIGSAGCTHELFDHSAVMQTEPSEAGIMQETCVTVTWIRLLSRLYLLTGDGRYYDRLERAAWNALYGALNTKQQRQLSRETMTWLDPLPFDSYSPLFNGTRGIGIGGLKFLEDGHYYGCCACIAAAGVALVPLTAVLREDAGLRFNALLPGTLRTHTPGSQDLEIGITSGFPAAMDSVLDFRLSAPDTFTLSLRIPSYAIRPAVELNGQPIEWQTDAGFLRIRRVWETGDRLAIRAEYDLTVIELNDKIAFEYGPLVLARDARKESADLDFSLPLALQAPLDACLRVPDPAEAELVRLTVRNADGSDLLLTDYASCGKHWTEERNRMTVWMVSGTPDKRSGSVPVRKADAFPVHAIVYTSETGHTKAYAELLGNRTHLPVFPLKDAVSAIPAGESVLYLGWLSAGTVKGYPSAAKRFEVKAVCGVGMASGQTQLDDIRRRNPIPGSTPVFYLQGGFEMEKLHGISRFMMRTMRSTVGKKLAAKPDRTAEEDEMLELLIHGGNRVSEANLQDVTAWLRNTP